MRLQILSSLLDTKDHKQVINQSLRSCIFCLDHGRSSHEDEWTLCMLHGFPVTTEERVFHSRKLWDWSRDVGEGFSQWEGWFCLNSNEVACMRMTVVNMRIYRTFL
ncbi:hypothetical protein SUGI_0466930 [Cryptomeria japonica]|nr:hypothetical protein SUGI_0466930 [Cryptomeria japonica]